MGLENERWHILKGGRDRRAVLGEVGAVLGRGGGGWVGTVLGGVGRDRRGGIRGGGRGMQGPKGRY